MIPVVGVSLVVHHGRLIVEFVVAAALHLVAPGSVGAERSFAAAAAAATAEHLGVGRLGRMRRIAAGSNLVAEAEMKRAR